MDNFCIQTEGLSKVFGKKKALDNFNLTVKQGGIHAVVGSNGAGKSTLFRVLLGISTPNEGRAVLLGEDSRQLSPQLRSRVGYVNEEHTLPGWMTARQVTNFQRHYYPHWNQNLYDFVIGYFDVDPKQKVSGLSRGERAGLNLAMAFAQSPELLILDEPTLGLDVVAKQSFLEAVMFTDTEGVSTILYCSHQMDEIERVADKLIIMEKGQLKNNSSPDEFMCRISHWVAEFDQDPPDKNAIPGYLNGRLIDDQFHYWVIDQDANFEQQLTAIGGKNVCRGGMSLSNAVNAMLSKGHATPDTTH